MHFKSKVRSRRVLALSIVLAMLLTLVTACNIDYEGLSEGLNDLGNAVSGYNPTPAAPETTESSEETSGKTEATTSSTEETTAETTMPTETEATETSETTETEETTSSETSETVPSESSSTSETTGEGPLPTPSATPTPTPTPTPHPSNERVDFSYLTSSNISENFVVDSETFSESVDTEDNQHLAVFSGKRVLVSKAGSENVSEAVNLILDSFYQEAAGLYSRYAGEAKAAYGLSGTVDTVYNIEVNFDYSYNKRVLSVVMSYKVTAGNKVLASKEEFSSFDMLTGQYVTLASVAGDLEGLQNALRSKLAKNEPIARASAITDLYIAAQQPGAQTATVEIYGMYNGKRVHTTGDMNEYAQYLNRYGKIIFGISDNSANTENNR